MIPKSWCLISTDLLPNSQGTKYTLKKFILKQV